MRSDCFRNKMGKAKSSFLVASIRARRARRLRSGAAGGNRVASSGETSLLGAGELWNDAGAAVTDWPRAAAVSTSQQQDLRSFASWGTDDGIGAASDEPQQQADRTCASMVQRNQRWPPAERLTNIAAATRAAAERRASPSTAVMYIILSPV
jgi:hypothetical protein